jgi:LPXTG-motif cell wall-anchored protein
MLKSRLLAVAFVAALLSVFGATAANAASYGPPAFTVTVNPGAIGTGDTFTVTFTSEVNCTWSLDEFEGQSAPAGSGKTYVVTLKAPTAAGDYTVTAECTWDPDATTTAGPVSRSHKVIPAVYVANASSDTLLADPQTDPVSAVVTVGSTSSGSGSGALPNTGGSNESLLIAGAGLVLVGAAVTVAARRRKTAA